MSAQRKKQGADEVTPRQRQLLEAVASWRGPGMPLLTSLADVLGLSSESGVRVLVRPLEERGFIDRLQLGEEGFPKPLLLTNKARALLGILPEPQRFRIASKKLETPLALTPASCGLLAEVLPEPVGHIEYLGEIFESYQRGDEIVVAEGDSMISPDSRDHSIFAGDRCLVRPDLWPEDGEPAYVEYWLDNGMRECAIKDWYADEKTGLVTLVPRNPEYPRIVRASDELKPFGVILEVLHSVRRRR